MKHRVEHIIFFTEYFIALEEGLEWKFKFKCSY